MLPRFLRPRLLLLPMLVGLLLTTAFLTASAVPGEDVDLHAGAVCKNEARPAKVVPPRTAPSCVNCRAPLLNAPVAQADRETTMPPIVALPPAA